MDRREARRREYLDAMEIDLWERRSPVRAAVQAVANGMADDAPAAVGQPLAVAPTSGWTTTDIASMDWDTLENAVRKCTRCPLYRTRTQAVFGVGSRSADWLFIGEAPGVEEDRQGEPFVGRAGQLLNAMLFAVGLKREGVYIANILKSRPPNNRDPQLDEIEACEPYLLRQIELVRPRIILALGRHAAHSLLKTELPLSRLRGRRLSYHGTPLVATYHPAYLLRNPVDKCKAWNDLCLAQSIVGAP